MTPESIMALVKMIIEFLDWFSKHRKNGKLGPVRRAWLQREYDMIEASKSKLSPEQLVDIEPKLQRIRDLLNGSQGE